MKKGYKQKSNTRATVEGTAGIIGTGLSSPRDSVIGQWGPEEKDGWRGI